MKNEHTPLETRILELNANLTRLATDKDKLEAQAAEMTDKLNALCKTAADPMALVSTQDNPRTLTLKESELKSDIALLRASLDALPERRKELHAETRIAKQALMQALTRRVEETKATVLARQRAFRESAEIFARQCTDSEKGAQDLGRFIARYPRARPNVARVLLAQCHINADSSASVFAAHTERVLEICRRCEVAK